MLHDSQTDLVFLPMALRLHFPSLYKSLTEAFDFAHVNYREIPDTRSKKHLWARDYMPITVDTTGGMELFEYNPDYLRAPRYAEYKPDIAFIMDEMGITPFHHHIIVDGGNILTDKKGRVYMTDKVFLENANIPRKELIKSLKRTLNTRSIKFVHWDKSDMYGHVDGMMAIADDDSLITDLSWEYLNFLRVGNKIFMAQLGKPSDEPAFKRIQEAFPNCIVYPIKYVQSLTRLGGGLHCATWNTVEKCYQNAKVFKTSKRHPFNPFDGGFDDDRFREVIEYGYGKPLEDSDWEVLLDAFYWFWSEHRLKYGSPNEMAEDVFNTLRWKLHPIFENYEFVESLCNHLYRYMIDIPKLIVPGNSKLASKDNSSPIIHFKDTDAFLTSFNVAFGDCSNSYEGELLSTEEIEKEAQLKNSCNNGIVYVLYYMDDNKRVCRNKYTLTAQKNFSFIKVILYFESPINELTIAEYVQKACSGISFYEHCRKADATEIPFSMTPECIDGWEVDEQTAIEHKATCVRQLLGSKYTQQELEQYCALYKITTEQFYKNE